MVDYRVSWALQDSAATSIAAAISAMDAELSEINSQMNGLIANWDSEAQRAYLSRQQQWNTAATNIKAACEQFKTGMITSSEIASGAEKTNVTVVSG